jgi:hypothetical protein
VWGKTFAPAIAMEPHAPSANYAQVLAGVSNLSTFHPMDPVQSISSKPEFSGQPMRKRGLHGQLMPDSNNENHCNTALIR